VPPLGGRIKDRWEDFVVEEIPLFPPAGEGEHLYVSITKTGMSTPEVVARLASALGVPQDRFGYAGLKDRRAVTTQVLSIHGVEESALAGCAIPGVSIQWASRHRHKLRAGALRGNRFRIVVRGLLRPDRELIQRALDEIDRRGFPNYFGAQRFGVRGEGHLVGRALLRREWETAVDVLLGAPRPSDSPSIRSAREAYTEGRYDAAFQLFGRRSPTEQQVLRYLKRAGPRHERAVRRMPRPARRLFISAYQSHLFNRVLARRLEEGRAGGCDRGRGDRGGGPSSRGFPQGFSGAQVNRDAARLPGPAGRARLGARGRPAGPEFLPSARDVRNVLPPRAGETGARGRGDR
jgi:tRNA pseudouridine13 synthase